MKTFFLSLLLVFGFSLHLAHADDPAAVAQVAAPAAQAAVEHATATVSDLSNKIPAAIPAMVLMILGLIADLVMRFWPTVKPRSMLLIVSGLFSAVAGFFNGIGGLFSKLSGLLDQVIQNLKADPTDKK